MGWKSVFGFRPRAGGFLVLLALMMFLAQPATAQPPGPGGPLPAVESDVTPVPAETTDAKPEPPSEYQNLMSSIEATIRSERETVDQLERQMEQAEAAEKEFGAEINAYNLQLSAHGNLLLSRDTPIEELERAWSAHQAAASAMTEKLAALKTRREAVAQSLKATEEQYELNQKQLIEMGSQGGDGTRTQAQVERFQVLIRLLTEKLKHFETLDERYARRMAQLKEVIEAYRDFSGRFEQEITSRRKDALFKRKDTLLSFFDWQVLHGTIDQLRRQAEGLLTRTFWVEQFQATGPIRPAVVISAAMLFFLTLFLTCRLRRYAERLDQSHRMAERYPWRSIALLLLGRSLPLLGATLFLYGYTHIRGYYTTVPLVQSLLGCLVAWLLTRWMIGAVRLWNERRTPPIPDLLVRRLTGLFLGIRLFIIAYLALAWLIGKANILLLLGRIVFLVSLIIWGTRFWHHLRRTDPDAERIIRLFAIFRRRRPPSDPEASDPGSARRIWIKTAILAAADVFVIGAVILEIAGYGSLSTYWMVSWGWTLVVIFWGGILLGALREAERIGRETAYYGPVDLPARPSDPFRWLVLKMSWIAWAALLILAILFVWGAKRVVILSAFRVLNQPLPIGDLQLSLSGLIWAVVVILFTHAVASLWKNTLSIRIFADSGLESGLKSSITVITVYLLWGFGILLALNVVGVSTTSMAVAFGALGIGLGFGLQNIFSNFVSGIILLFERPIQVGDAVEVNGIWGEVKRINVRSTVVQTYDNAALIIPNSDFISSQVTNWSFKDVRIRRIISVGVAYGSDVESVKRVLLEIPDTIPNVLKYPRPYVLFTHFGDSSLDFELRLWTDIDNMLTVDSMVRFEINRRFREAGIQIPFPQRDVHFYPERPAPASSAMETAPPDGPPPGGHDGKPGIDEEED